MNWHGVERNKSTKDHSAKLVPLNVAAATELVAAHGWADRGMVAVHYVVAIEAAHVTWSAREELGDRPAKSAPRDGPNC